MKEYSGWEYLLIDVANNSPFGLDKKVFEERIAWATENLTDLEIVAEYQVWKERPLYIKAVMAVRAAQRGEPSGHLVGLDAVCSGMQLMAAVTGCLKGAEATGLIDPNRRADAYTDCTKIMSRILGKTLDDSDRDNIKQATMTSLYGSKAEPIKVFGEGTDELNAFYQALYELAPGPCELLEALLQSWQEDALLHAWKLPDGYDARVKVMQEVETRIEVDELDHATFTYVYYVNEGEPSGVKNAANVVHSLDGYVLRSLVRRCNYDADIMVAAQQLIEWELLERAFGQQQSRNYAHPSRMTQYYCEQYRRSNMPDIVMIPHLTEEDVICMGENHLRQLNQIITSMLEHKPFPIVTVHDDFRAHPNNLNHVRKHYREILAQLAESNVISDILSQLHKREGTFPKFSTSLPQKIRQSAYALC